MNFIIISSTLIVSIIVFISVRNNKHQDDIERREFLEREKNANSVRKKSIDNLNYITIPDEILNMQPTCITPELKSYLSDLNDLSSSKIVNLTGYSNTDLKLEYGTANITILSDYDFNYTNLVTLLQKIAQMLHSNNDDALAIRVLEFAISTGSDVSSSYYLLADLYKNAGTPKKIESLINQAQNTNSLLKDTIIKNLKNITINELSN